jgi:hypothetical protein
VSVARIYIKNNKTFMSKITIPELVGRSPSVNEPSTVCPLSTRYTKPEVVFWLHNRKWSKPEVVFWLHNRKWYKALIGCRTDDVIPE